MEETALQVVRGMPGLRQLAEPDHSKNASARGLRVVSSSTGNCSAELGQQRSPTICVAALWNALAHKSKVQQLEHQLRAEHVVPSQHICAVSASGGISARFRSAYNRSVAACTQLTAPRVVRTVGNEAEGALLHVAWAE